MLVLLYITFITIWQVDRYCGAAGCANHLQNRGTTCPFVSHSEFPTPNTPTSWLDTVSAKCVCVCQALSTSYYAAWCAGVVPTFRNSSNSSSRSSGTICSPPCALSSLCLACRLSSRPSNPHRVSSAQRCVVAHPPARSRQPIPHQCHCPCFRTRSWCGG